MTLNIEENKHLLVRDCDGYINATALCKAGGKLFGHYQENNQTKAYIQALEDNIGIHKIGIFMLRLQALRFIYALSHVYEDIIKQ